MITQVRINHYLARKDTLVLGQVHFYLSFFACMIVGFNTMEDRVFMQQTHRVLENDVIYSHDDVFEGAEMVVLSKLVTGYKVFFYCLIAYKLK